MKRRLATYAAPSSSLNTRLSERLVERALAMEGTCTGEHGVGTGKIKYLPLEHDAETMMMMHRIKDAMDPLGLMNPGKVLGA